MKTRVLAAVALLPLLFVCIFFLPRICTAIVFGLAGAIGAYERLMATGHVKHPRLVAYAALSAFLMSIWSWAGQNQGWFSLLVVAVFAAYFGEMMANHIKLTFDKIAMCMVAALVVPYLLTSLVRILSMRLGRYYIIVPFLMASCLTPAPILRVGPSESISWLLSSAPRRPSKAWLAARFLPCWVCCSTA